MTEESITFNGLEAVLSHFATNAKDIEAKAATYRLQLTELTGHNPDKPVTALDVVKIVQKVFFAGELHAANGQSSHSGGVACPVVNKPADAGAAPVAPQAPTSTIY